MTNEVAPSPPTEDAQGGFNDVTWEDVALARLLSIRDEYRAALADVYEAHEISYSGLGALIKERCEANNIDELEVGQRVRCGTYVFKVRENARDEETIIPPFRSKGITGIEAE